MRIFDSLWQVERRSIPQFGGMVGWAIRYWIKPIKSVFFASVYVVDFDG